MSESLLELRLIHLLLFTKQMVSTLEGNGIRLEFYQSDRGSEAMLLANAQLQFEQWKILTPLLITARDMVHPNRVISCDGLLLPLQRAIGHHHNKT